MVDKKFKLSIKIVYPVHPTSCIAGANKILRLACYIEYMEAANGLRICEEKRVFSEIIYQIFYCSCAKQMTPVPTFAPLSELPSNIST